jgi:PRD domain protein (TIGR03582 family)
LRPTFFPIFNTKTGKRLAAAFLSSIFKMYIYKFAIFKRKKSSLLKQRLGGKVAPISHKCIDFLRVFKKGGKVNQASLINQAQETQIQALGQSAYAQTLPILAEAGRNVSELQSLKLMSHLNAMARRAVTGESLPEFDVAIFDEVSAEAMALAKKIVDVFDGLPLTEVYLLSLHFEVAD